MHTNLFHWFNSLNNQVRTLVMKLLKVVLSRNSYCNTTSQSVFVSFAMCMARPLIKLKRFILLVIYSWLRLRVMRLILTIIFSGLIVILLFNPRQRSISLRGQYQ